MVIGMVLMTRRVIILMMMVVVIVVDIMTIVMMVNVKHWNCLGALPVIEVVSSNEHTIIVLPFMSCRGQVNDYSPISTSVCGCETCVVCNAGHAHFFKVCS